MQNKLRLARIIRDETGVSTDPRSMFDVQIKRIHEYKRQLLNVLRVIHDYLRIVEDGDAPADAAHRAVRRQSRARILGRQADHQADPQRGRRGEQGPTANQLLRVAFLPDYRVSLAESIIPAADLSEQISTAGMEASGTGNMKLMMNGAVTVATWDGANIEIAEEAGEDNIYIFGLRAEQIEQMQRNGLYQSREYYERDPRIKRVLDCFLNDRFSPSEPGLFRWIFDELINRGDRFFHVADLPQYIDINAEDRRRFPGHRKVAAHGDPEHGALAQIFQRPHHPGIQRRHLEPEALPQPRAGNRDADAAASLGLTAD